MFCFNRRKKYSSDSGDKYTYFVTSPESDAIFIRKLHVCTWLYGGRKENVEVGLQFGVRKDKLEAFKAKLRDKNNHRLSIRIWASWARDDFRSEEQCLYDQISTQEMAKFLFNADCIGVKNCLEWSSSGGRELQFSDNKLFVFPVEVQIEAGHVDLLIKIPDTYEYDKDAYVRFCTRVPRSTISLRTGFISHKICAYNIIVNQMRNAPNSPEFNSGERCEIQSAYAIHIVPTAYGQKFIDKDAFRGLRFLEAEKYTKYVEKVRCLRQKITQDKMIVSFNKIVPKAPTDANTSYTFCSIFEKDFFGLAQWLWNLSFALIGAALGCLLSFYITPGVSMFGRSAKNIEGNPESVTSPQNINTNETATVN